MRITKLMGLAVTVVALAVVINTLALSSASVTNSFSIGVVATNAALLSISAPGTPDADFTISDTGETFSLTLEEGVQANATYIFGNVMTITNRTDAKTVTLGYSNNSTGNVTITLKDASDNANISGKNLAPGASITAYMEIVTNSSAVAANSATTLTITGN